MTALNLIIDQLQVALDLAIAGDTARTIHRLRGLLQAVQHFSKEAPDATEISYLQDHVRNNIGGVHLAIRRIITHCESMEEALGACGKLSDCLKDEEGET